jgi:hypothetical protein
MSGALLALVSGARLVLAGALDLQRPEWLATAYLEIDATLWKVKGDAKDLHVYKGWPPYCFHTCKIRPRPEEKEFYATVSHGNAYFQKLSNMFDSDVSNLECFVFLQAKQFLTWLASSFWRNQGWLSAFGVARRKMNIWQHWVIG